jgi:hypothetical protein
VNGSRKPPHGRAAPRNLRPSSSPPPGLEAELDRLRSGAAEPVDDGLAAELESMTRERNQLAAELAVLRAERAR